MVSDWPQALRIAGRPLRPSEVFDAYWWFAAERQAIYLARLRNEPPPWTGDPVLHQHRFTNVFRAADRVSQFLIAEVQRGPAAAGLAAEDLVFRTLLFKIFNREDTWRRLEQAVGAIQWSTYDFDRYREALDEAAAAGPVYSAAYVMPPPRRGEVRKYANHLRLVEHMMCSDIARKVLTANSLEDIYDALLGYQGIGAFLAFQYTIDLNYLELLPFDEDDFVVPGPGARDGIRKCFGSEAMGIESDVIRYVVDSQEEHCERLGLSFPGLFGRRLHLIDAQNLFCEIGKYARVRYPTVAGVSGRSRIKQRFTPKSKPTVPVFPTRWDLVPVVPEGQSVVDDRQCPSVEINGDNPAIAVAKVPPRGVARQDRALPFGRG